LSGGDTLTCVTSDAPVDHEPARQLLQRRWVWIAVGFATLLTLWASLAARQLSQARDLALDGVDRLESARALVSVDAVTEGELTVQLEEAASAFASAHSRIRSPLLAPLRLVPWIGTQVRSADALSRSAGVVTDALAAAAADIAHLSSAAGDMNRVAVATEALTLSRQTRDVLDGVDLGPDAGLTGSLADARRRFATELEEATRLLSDFEVAAAGVAEFLEGPNTYLLLAANNSEMQAGSGSYLMAGTVRIVNGRLEAAELRPTSELLLERDSVEIQDEDLAARWGWLDLAVDWRNLSPSPRFPANAELAAAMWKELEGEDVDGVIVLDPVSLAAILSATGPVDVDGRTIDAGGVVRELLFEQYWEDDVEVRRDRLKEIASAALRTVDESDTDLVTLAKVLQDAAAGRHLMLWSHHPRQQEAWQVVGIDGTLTPDSLSVAVLNRGANKLDGFLNIGARLFREADTLVTFGPDGDSQVIAVWVEIPPGQLLVQELKFTLPGSHALRIEPSARVPGIVWAAAGRRWIDAADAVLDLTTGTVTGEALERAIAPIAFEPDPLNNPVAPIPFMRIDGDVETSVFVSWQKLQSNPGIDVWERAAGGDWALVGIDLTTTPLILTDRTRREEYCYRTALHVAPDRFSAIECLVVPAALGYVRFFGDPGDYFSAPDFVGSGDLDVRVLVAPDEWKPDFWQMFLGQYDSQPNDRSWRFGIDTFDALVGNFSQDGFEDLGANRQLSVSFGDGRRKWVRMTIEPTGGVLRFWTSNGGSVWTQLGDDRTFNPINGLHDSTGPVYIGTDRPGSDNPFAGKLYYIEIRAGVNGPVVASLDFRTQAQLDATSGRWTDDHGNVFSPHGTGWEYVGAED